MDFDFGLFLRDNLEAAGVIGAYVSLSLITVTVLTYWARQGNMRISSRVPKWGQPLIGGLFGLIPGCGGTIIVTAMYRKQKISFGGLFASFITTLGEGSFVLLGASQEADVAGNLKALAILGVISFVVGVPLGWSFDRLGLRPIIAQGDKCSPHSHGHDSVMSFSSLSLVDKIAVLTLLPLAALLAPESIMALWGGSFSLLASLTPYLYIALSAISIIYYLIHKFSPEEHDCSFKEDLKSSIFHAVEDIGLIVSYVFLGLIATNYLIDVVVGVETFNSWMQSSSLLLILLAAFLGVLPGCGGMIAVAVAFITVPGFPISALLAAGIATSGDGIFPLFAANKRDALIVSLAGLVVAIVVGYLAMALGV